MTHTYGDLNDGNAIATDGGGDIYVAGGTFSNSLGVGQSAVFKFTDNGAPVGKELCFPKQAIRPKPMHSLSSQARSFWWRGQTALADGKNMFFVTRYAADGELDTTFGAEQGNAGVVTTDITTSDDGALALAVTSDRIVAAGFAGRRTLQSRRLSSSTASTASLTRPIRRCPPCPLAT